MFALCVCACVRVCCVQPRRAFIFFFVFLVGLFVAQLPAAIVTRGFGSIVDVSRLLRRCKRTRTHNRINQIRVAPQPPTDRKPTISVCQVIIFLQ